MSPRQVKKPRNKFEAKIFKQLTKNKVSFKYESEKIPYIFSGYYLPDFVIKTKTGFIYIETKGYFRPEHKRKLVAVKKLNPKLDIRLVFYSEKEKDIKWAVKNGFRYAVDVIPQEWLDGF